MAVIAVSGPTCDIQPVFDWSQSQFNTTVPHRGQPVAFNFSWVTYTV